MADKKDTPRKDVKINVPCATSKGFGLKPSKRK